MGTGKNKIENKGEEGDRELEINWINVESFMNLRYLVTLTFYFREQNVIKLSTLDQDMWYK